MTPFPHILHASAFAYAGAGCLLLGDPGSGKSTALAQALLHGAQFIADDNVQISARDGALIAQAPPHMEGVMHLHGIGLIRLSSPFAGEPNPSSDLVGGNRTVMLPPTKTLERFDSPARGEWVHPIHLAITLTDQPIDPLPTSQTMDFLGIKIPHLQLPKAPHTPVASLLLYLQAMQENRILPEDWRLVNKN